MTNYIVGLDIGSKTIKAAVGEIKRDGNLSVRALFTGPSAGIKKGVVDDIGDATQALSPILTEIKKRYRSADARMFVGIGASDLKVHSSIGVVAVSRADYEIYGDDISRAIQSAGAVNTPPNRMILHAIVKEYIVDGVTDIKDPLGMNGNRLEVNSLIIEVFAPAIKNMSKCIEMLGSKIKDFILTPLADARAVLSKEQKGLGVVVIDIGFGKTSMCVYEEDKLMHAAIFPVGSGNITNDIAIGLRIPVAMAETIKISFGSALSKDISVRETIELSKIKEGIKGVAKKKFIAEIIESRLSEIFEFINNDLKLITKAGKLPAGAILVGGGVKIPGIVELAKRELALPIQLGIPDAKNIEITTNELALQLEDPTFACSYGLLLWGYDTLTESKPLPIPGKGALKKILRYFAP